MQSPGAGSHTQATQLKACDGRVEEKIAGMRQEQLGVSSTGAKDFQQGLEVGYNREQRADAALDVLAAGTAQAREEHKTPTVTGSTRHVDWSINSSMSVSRSAR